MLRLDMCPLSYDGCLQVNALEQLCINWSDEKIEHFYVQSMFRDMLERCRWVWLEVGGASSLYFAS